MKMLLEKSVVFKLFNSDQVYAWQLCQRLKKLIENKIEIFVSDQCLDDCLFEFCGLSPYAKGDNQEEAMKKLVHLRNSLELLRIKIIKYNDFFQGKDFFLLNPRLKNNSSNMYIAFAKQKNLSGILTHNPFDFKHPTLKILSVEGLIESYTYEKLHNETNPFIVDISDDSVYKTNFLVNSNSQQSLVNTLEYSIKSFDSSVDSFLSNIEEYYNSYHEYFYHEYFLKLVKKIDLQSLYNFFPEDVSCKDSGKTTIIKHKNLEISTVRWNKNEGTQCHVHNDSVCVTYVASGRLAEEKFLNQNFNSDGVNYYEQGAWNLVRLGTKHIFSNKEDECLELIIFKLFLLDSIADEYN